MNMKPSSLRNTLLVAMLTFAMSAAFGQDHMAAFQDRCCGKIDLPGERTRLPESLWILAARLRLEKVPQREQLLTQLHRSSYRLFSSASLVSEDFTCPTATTDSQG
jgi:hypothetical protein